MQMEMRDNCREESEIREKLKHKQAKQVLEGLKIGAL